MVFAGRTGQQLTKEPFPHIASSFSKHPSPMSELPRPGSLSHCAVWLLSQPCAEPLLPRSRASHI